MSFGLDTTFVAIATRRKDYMNDFRNLFTGFSLHVKQNWSDVLNEERTRLRNAVVTVPPSRGSFDTELVIKASTTKEDILRMCIFVNLIPELQFLKYDLTELVWKRFFRPYYLYDVIGNRFDVRRLESNESISAILHIERINVERKFSEPYSIKCVGAKLTNDGSRHFYLQCCFLLLQLDADKAIKDFLALICKSGTERWLFGQILNRKNHRRKHLFEYKGFDTRPVKKPQRRRGYNDKGTLRDATIPQPEPFPFAFQEIEKLNELTKTVKDNLSLMQQELTRWRAETDCFDNEKLGGD